MIFSASSISTLQALMFYQAVTSPDPVSYLLNFGALGAMVALLALGIFRWKGEVIYLQQENKELRDIIRNFQVQMTTRTMPALERNIEVLEAVPERESAMIKAFEKQQQEMRDLMEQMKSTSDRRAAHDKKRNQET